MKKSNIYGMQGVKYVCKNTWQMFTKTFWPTIILLLLYNIIDVNIYESDNVSYLSVIFNVFISPLLSAIPGLTKPIV